MSRVELFVPAFVVRAPDTLDEGRLYISMEFATALHLCPCGCRREIVTPLRPGRWRLIYDGEVTLRPSIGSWGLPCGSHYFILRNRVVWARSWSAEEVQASRRRSRGRASPA